MVFRVIAAKNAVNDFPRRHKKMSKSKREQKRYIDSTRRLSMSQAAVNISMVGHFSRLLFLRINTWKTLSSLNVALGHTV